MSVWSRALIAVAIAVLETTRLQAQASKATRESAMRESAMRESAIRESGVRRAAHARDSVKTTTRFDDTFRKYTKRHFGPGFDWTLFKAQAMAESDLNPNARSRVGARGLMQLMPSTFQLIRTKRPEFGPINDPEWNIAAGIMHDRYLYRLYEPNIVDPDRMRFVFASYNAGEGTIARAAAVARAKALNGSAWSNIETIAPTVPRWRYRETLGYVRRIDSNHVNLARKRP